MFWITIILSILSTHGMQELSDGNKELCPLETLGCLLAKGMGECSSLEVNDFCNGRHACENLEFYPNGDDFIHGENMYTYCCEKFGVCVYSTASDKVPAAYLDVCTNAVAQNKPVRFNEKRACCKRGIGCDLEIFTAGDRDQEFCNKFKDGACVPNDVRFTTAESCCHILGYCNINGFCSSDYWDVHPDPGYKGGKSCFFPDPVTCLHPYQFGYCCDTYNMCTMPVCDAEFA